MEQGAEIVLRNVYTVTLELLRVKTIESIEIGDISLTDLRDRLTTELEKLNESINVLRTAPLKDAQQNVRKALNAENNDENADALDYFKIAEQNATQAFNLAVNFEGKVLATKLNLFSVVSRIRLTNKKISYCQTQCQDIFNTLLNSAEVKSAMASESKSIMQSILNKAGSVKTKRECIYAEISQIRFVIYSYLGFWCPVLNHKLRHVHLYKANGTFLPNITDGQQQIEMKCCTQFDNFLIFAGRFNGFYVTKADSMDVFHRDSEFKADSISAFCVSQSQRYLFVGLHSGSIVVYDFETKTKVSTIDTTLPDVKCMVHDDETNKLYCTFQGGGIEVLDTNSFHTVNVKGTPGVVIYNMRIWQDKLFCYGFGNFVVYNKVSLQIEHQIPDIINHKMVLIHNDQFFTPSAVFSCVNYSRLDSYRVGSNDRSQESPVCLRHLQLNGVEYLLFCFNSCIEVLDLQTKHELCILKTENNHRFVDLFVLDNSSIVAVTENGDKLIWTPQQFLELVSNHRGDLANAVLKNKK